MKSETPREIAESIVSKIPHGSSKLGVIEDIEAALNAERERCAKIAETYYSSGGQYIAGRIRGNEE